MSLVITQDKAIFNREEIKPRDFIRVQYHTWSEPRNGLILSCDEYVIQALFFPAIHQAACYFRVTADKVKDGKWKLQYVSFDNDWNMTTGSEDFADRYNPTSTEDDADSSEIIEE